MLLYGLVLLGTSLLATSDWLGTSLLATSDQLYT